MGLDEVKVEKAHVNAGEEVKIRAGDLIIDSREFDIYHTCKLESVGGYIPILLRSMHGLLEEKM